MKKSKLTIGLVTGFVGTLALASCGITESKDTVMEFTDYNGNIVKVLTDDIYGDYAKTSSGLAKYYDAVLETLIRYNYQNSKFTGLSELAKDYATIENLAKNEVTSEKKKAEQTAKTNNTKFDDEWEAVLEEKGCETEEELVKYYVYQFEKEEMETWYYKKNETSLLKQYLGVDNNYASTVKADVNSMFPYHMRHILVKTSGSASNYTRDVITESEAQNLSNALVLLTQAKDGKRVNTFGAVAGMSINEDTSKDSYGDLGMVTTETSFVNEFKLGIYAYDALFSKINAKDTANADLYAGLGLESKVKNSGTTGTVTEKLNAIDATNKILSAVPVKVFSELGEYKDKVKDNNGKEVCEGAEVLYPRNILWNQYLNIHNIFVITNEDLDGTALAANPCFKTMSVNGVNKDVLVDEQDRPVVCVRSQYGIHFMVMEKSIFKNTNALAKDAKYQTKLEDYYTTKVPETVAATDPVTYITSINRTDTIANYRTRADAIKSAVKAFDKTYDYRLFETLMDKTVTGIEVNFKDVSLKGKIETYISNQKASNKDSANKTLNESWRTYIELLEQQFASRVTYEPAGDSYKGTLYQTVCYQKFGTANTTDKAAFEKGGICYYGK